MKVPVHLTVLDAIGYVDNLVATSFNNSGELPFAINETMIELMERYLGVHFFELQFGSETATALSTTHLLRYLEKVLTIKRL